MRKYILKLLNTLNHLVNLPTDMISIVLPTFNEAGAGYLEKILESFSNHEACEILLVDGGSTDGTLELLKSTPWTVVELARSSRAARLQRGLELSSGEVVLLHHPRSLLSSDAFAQLQDPALCDRALWGGFTHDFDWPHPLLKFTSWYSNRVRVDARGIVYLDHCLFIHRSLIEKGFSIPDLQIFEDTAISESLRRHCMPQRLAAKACTSAIRFRRNGVLKQITMNQLLKLGYYCGMSPEKMNRWYEKGLGLNQG